MAKTPTPRKAKVTSEIAGVPVTRTRISGKSGGGAQVRSSFFNGVFTAAKTFFEAASRSIRVERAVDVGPNGANGEIERVRSRSRWMYANDSFYRQGCRQVANNVIHYGIKPNIKDPILRKKWAQWGREADARGRLDFYGMQWLTGVVVPRDGEGLVRFRQRQPGDMKSGINFQLQCLEADHMPLSYTQQAPNGNWIVSGVERNGIDRPVAYWLYDHHPKDWQGIGKGNNFIPKRVPAEDVIHIYMPDRFSDTRGYPWGASAQNTVEALRTYDDAEIERKKGQAMFGGFFKKPRIAGIDDGSVADEVDVDGTEFKSLEPNSWVQLPEDWDVELSQPAATDANYALFRREGLSGLAVSLGLAVEMVTLNMQYLNDRQYRALMIEVQRYIESLQYHMFVVQFCKPIWRRFVSEAVLNGLWSVPAGEDIEDYMEVEWMAPAREHIHPLQQIQAYAEAVKAGLNARKRLAAAMGEDIEDIDTDNENDLKRSKAAGLHYSVYQPQSETETGGTLASAVDDYGVAVRAGAITPQAADEAAFRESFGLPPMGTEVAEFWAVQGGIKKPITLAKQDDVVVDPVAAVDTKPAAASSSPPLVNEFDEDDKVSAQ